MTIINSYISSRITDPIKELEKSVNEIEAGNLETEVRSGGSYEIQHLAIPYRTWHGRYGGLWTILWRSMNPSERASSTPSRRRLTPIPV